MKILITGANGQVGWELCRQAVDYGFGTIPTDLNVLDITDINAVRALALAEAPDIIVNAAAYTAVDKAEQQPELAHAVNALGPKHLATTAAEMGIPLFHLSTDYVFSGDKLTAYSESDPVAPLGVYGETKQAGEAFVSESTDRQITLRTSWVFGIEGANFVKTMIRLGQEKSALNVIADQKGCPTYAGDIARALLMLAARFREQGELPWGLYHFCGAGVTTWYDFAQSVFEQAVAQQLLTSRPTVNPITTEEYPTPAKRPANSELNCAQFNATFPEIGQASWQEGLNQVITHLKRSIAQPS